jgi:hypothetical protein
MYGLKSELWPSFKSTIDRGARARKNSSGSCETELVGWVLIVHSVETASVAVHFYLNENRPKFRGHNEVHVAANQF